MSSQRIITFLRGGKIMLLKQWIWLLGYNVTITYILSAASDPGHIS